MAEVGDVGFAGKSDSKGLVAGGSAGDGGKITINAGAVTIQGTVSGFWGTTAVTHVGSSVLALGSSGAVVINGAAGGAVSLPSAYSTNGDYFSSKRDVPVSLAGTLSTGGIEAGNQPGAININGTPFNSPILTATKGPGAVAVTESGAGEVVFAGDTFVTPAELVAILQRLGGKQLLNLDNQGRAIGGEFSVAAANLPVGGFSNILLPSGVTLHVNVPVVTTADISIGTAAVLEVNQATTFNVASLSILGTITSTTGDLTIQGTGAGQSLGMTFGANGKLQTSAGNILFNVASAGPINTVSNALGAITAGGSGKLVAFNGGAAAVSVSVQSIGGIVSGSGNPFSVSVGGTSAVTLGSITTIGALSVSAPGGMNQAAGSSIVAGSLLLSSNGGNINLGLGGATSGSLSSPLLQVNSISGSVSILDAVAVSLSGSAAGGQFTLSDPVSITTTGATSFASGVFSTPLLNNLFALSATGGGIVVSSQQGQNLIVSGNGSFNGNTLSFNSSEGLGFTGNQTLTTTTATLTATGIEIESGSKLTVNGNLVVNADVLFNPSGLSVTGSTTLNVGSGAATFGVIANSTGDVVLGANTLVNTSGKNLAIIASRNVSSTAFGTINLSSFNGPSGSLTVIAGVDFTPATAGQVLDSGTEFLVTGASATGGSINLANTTIDTSNFSFNGTNRGGNVTMLAGSGSENPGNIVVGGINTSSQRASGGNVKLIAPGGVAVNGGINSSGVPGGGAVVVSATGFSSGQIKVKNALLSPLANVQPLPAVDGAGGAVSINGAINSTSSSGAGGNVRIAAEAQIVLSSVITSGLASAGSIDVLSLNGYVSVSGDLTSAALGNTSSASTVAGGHGADITVSVPQFVMIGGSINAAGGSTMGTGDGGAAGSVTLSTSTRDNALGLFTGNVAINGSINVSGGTARTTSGGGFGGPGGRVSIDAGALQVKGALFQGVVQASILASGGAGNAGTGAVGSVSLRTFAVQPIPSNFNLTSTTASEFALPGGLFTVGGFNVVNGTANSIVAGAATASSSNASSLTQGIFSQGTISITVSGGSQTINVAGSNQIIGPRTGADRTRVTPAEALALYQVSLAGSGAAQTIGISSTRQVSSVNPQTGLSPSTITVPGFDLPVSFSSFVLSATGNSAAVNLNVTGANPVLNLSSAFTLGIDGQLAFSTAGARAAVASGFATLTTNQGSSITSSGSLILSSSVTNNGTLSANQLVLLSPNGFFTFQNNAAGTISASNIVVPSNAMPLSASFVNQGGSMTAAVLVTPMAIPTTFGQPAVTATPGGTTPAAVNLTFTLAGPGNSQQTAQIGGQIRDAGVLLISTFGSSVSRTSTPLRILANSDFSANSLVSLNSSGDLSMQSGARLSSNGSTLMFSQGGFSGSGNNSISGTFGVNMIFSTAMNFGANTSLNSTNGLISVINNGGGITFGAGTQATAPFGLLMISSSGGITLGSAGSLSNFSASTGSLLFLGSSININNSLISGKSGLNFSANTGSLIDSGGNTLTSSSGLVFLSASSGISVGAGSTYSGNFGVFFSATGLGGAVAVGGAGGATKVSSGNGSIFINAPSGGMSFTDVRLTGTLMSFNTIGSFTDNGSNVFTSTGSILLNAGAISIGAASSYSGNQGVFIGANSASGAITIGSAAGATTSLSAANGLVFVNAPAGGLSLTKVDLNGNLVFLNSVGPLTDNGGSKYTATTGGINILAVKDVTLGSGTAVTSKQGFLVSTGAKLTMGAPVGGATSIDGGSGFGFINANGVTMTNTQLLSNGGFFVNGGSDLIDNGGSSLSSTQSLFLSASGRMSFGAGTSISGSMVSFSTGSGGGSFGAAGAPMTVNSTSSVSFLSGGNVATNGLKINAATSLSINAFSGTFDDTGSSALSSSGAAVTISARSIGLGGGSTVTGQTGVSLTAGSGAVVHNGSGIIAKSGTLAIQASTTVALNGNLTAGTLGAGPPATAAIVASGAIAVTGGNMPGAGGISVGSNRTFTAAGGHITMTASGAIIMGTGNVFESHGGNISILSTDDVTGNTSNTFFARATGTPMVSNGGLIEIGAGSTVSQLATAVTRPSGTQPAPGVLGSNVTINNSGGKSGVVQANTANGGTVNLSPTTGSVLNLSGGAIVFNASGRKVTLDGATFTVSAFKPVGFVEKISGPQGGVQATACDGGSIGPDSEPIDDAERGVNSAAAQPQMQDVAYLFVAGESSPHLLQFCKTETKQQPAIEFQSGEMYVHPTQNLSIDCGVGCVRVAKGAFICISRTNSYLRVAVCSGPDEVSLVLPSGNDSSLRSRSIRLNPGEEIVVRERELAHGERQKLDGIGRRRFSKYAIPSQTTGGVTATLCEFSIVSALGSVPHLRCVSQGSGKVEQRLREKLLKTASVLQMISSHRGAYQAHCPPDI